MDAGFGDGHDTASRAGGADGAWRRTPSSSGRVSPTAFMTECGTRDRQVLGDGAAGAMKVHVIGSSGTFPVPGRPASGYLIEQGTTRVWCDAGPDTYTRLPVAPDLIDAIVISHQHPDHCSDLLTAFHAWRYRPEPRLGVPVYGPQSVWDRVSSFLDSGQGSHLGHCFEFHPVEHGTEIELGGDARRLHRDGPFGAQRSARVGRPTIESCSTPGTPGRVASGGTPPGTSMSY